MTFERMSFLNGLILDAILPDLTQRALAEALSQHPDLAELQLHADKGLYHECAYDKRLDLLEYIYKYTRIDINAGGSTSPLDSGCDSGSPEVVRWLLAHGANPNFTNHVGEPHNCLVSAIYAQPLEIIKLLVEHGADVNLTWGDPKHPTNALQAAVQTGKKHVFEYLRSVGAKLPSELDSGKTKPKGKKK